MLMRGAASGKVLQPKPVHVHPVCFADLTHHLKQRLGMLPYEEMHAYFLRSRAPDITGLAYTGEPDNVRFCSRTILRGALIEDAEHLLLVHNHPSGSPVPSAQDVTITKAFAEGCRQIGLRLYDHLIVTAADHYSFRRDGLI